jgi:plasmid stabilization system protein ParE
MRYTVLWKPRADDELTSIWLAAEDRDAVTQASAEIELALKHDAALKGESRSGNKRILLLPPLGVEFSVIEDDRMVYISAVWSFRPHRPSA